MVPAVARQEGGDIMLLKDKNAIVYEARGYVGSHVARAFARDGARVFLAGDLGPQGIRVVCLRPEAIPETWAGDHIEVRTYMDNGTALGRLPTQVSGMASGRRQTTRIPCGPRDRKSTRLNSSH